MPVCPRCGFAFLEGEAHECRGRRSAGLQTLGWLLTVCGVITARVGYRLYEDANSSGLTSGQAIVIAGGLCICAGIVLVAVGRR